MTDQNNDSTINIIPADTHGDILVQLIRGQERAFTQLELQNRRLFGGDGQQGSIPALFKLQQDLSAKLDSNKDDLVNKIDEFKEALTVKIDDVEDQHDKLNLKVNWYLGGLAALGTALTFLLGALGIYHKAH